MSASRRDGGFTLIEMMVVVALVSLLSALGVGAWKQWTIAHAQVGAAADMQTILRQTQVRAVTEGQNFCVKFGTPANTYTIYRGSCDASPVKVNGPIALGDARLTLENINFTSVSAAAATDQIMFRRSGSATAGSLQIKRSGSTKIYTVSVEGLTGRVTFS